MSSSSCLVSSATPSPGSGNVSQSVNGYMSFILFSVTGLACKRSCYSLLQIVPKKLGQLFVSLVRQSTCSCVCLLESSELRAEGSYRVSPRRGVLWRGTSRFTRGVLWTISIAGCSVSSVNLLLTILTPKKTEKIE